MFNFVIKISLVCELFVQILPVPGPKKVETHCSKEFLNLKFPLLKTFNSVCKGYFSDFSEQLLMEFKLKVRQNQLDNLQQFIDTSKSQINAILNELGWTEEKVKDEDFLVSCIFDKTHRVSTKNLQEHLKCCGLKNLEYSLDEVQLSEPCDNAKSVVLIDDEKKTELFTNAQQESEHFRRCWNGSDHDPKTSDRLLSTFSTSERLAMYDYSISVTKGPTPPPEFMAFPNNTEDCKSMTYEEQLERDRDMKRRRMKYKSVHTNRKSHTEVIREVIENQMELYADYKAAGTRCRERSTSNYKNEKVRADDKQNATTRDTIKDKYSSYGCIENGRSSRSSREDSKSYGRSAYRSRSRSSTTSKYDKFENHKHHYREHERDRRRRSRPPTSSSRRSSERTQRKSRERPLDVGRCNDFANTKTDST